MTPTTVCRYEAGKEPATAVLTSLVGLLSNVVHLGNPDAELKALYDLFEAKRRSDIVSQSVRSSGTGRRVPIADLQLFRSGLEALASGLPLLLDSSEAATAEKKQEIVRRLLDVARQLLEVVGPYLASEPEVELSEEWLYRDLTKWVTTDRASSEPIQPEKMAS